MSESDDAAIATAFRAMFDRAMDDAPPPPALADIESARAHRMAPRSDRRWLPALAAASLVLAVVGAVVLLSDGGPDTVITSDRSDVDETTPDPSTSMTPVPSTSMAPSTGPGPAGPPADVPASLVVTDDTGARLVDPDGNSTIAVDDEVDIAHGAADGRVFALVPAPEPEAPGAIVEWDPATDSLRELDVPNPSGGSITLHDVAEVGDTTTLLYDHDPATCDVANDDCDISLWSFEPDTGESTRLVTLNGARDRWVGLSLASSGLVVGEIAGEDGTGFFSGLARDGLTIEPLQAADLGLAVSPAECSNCPRGFATDATGDHVVWWQGPDLVVVDVDEPGQRLVARDVVPDLGQSGGEELVISGVVDLEIVDGEITGGVVSFATGVGPALGRSAVVDLSDGTLTRFDGVVTLV